MDTEPSVPPSNPDENFGCNLAGKQSGVKAKETMKPIEKYTLAVAWAGLIIAALTGGVFYSQFREMQRQTGILNAQARQTAADSIEAGKRVDRQLAIAQQQANALEKNAEAVRDQMRLAERSWVGMTRGQVDITIGQPLVYRLEIKNTGRTPAFALQAYTHFDQLPAGELAKHELPWKPNAEQILHPGQENDVGVRGDRPVSQAAFDTIKHGQAVLWVRTQLRYKDAFGASHRLVICGTVNPEDMHSLNACPSGYQNAD